VHFVAKDQKHDIIMYNNHSICQLLLSDRCYLFNIFIA